MSADTPRTERVIRGRVFIDQRRVDHAGAVTWRLGLRRKGSNYMGAYARITLTDLRELARESLAAIKYEEAR